MFSPEVRDRAVRRVSDHEREHPSPWAAMLSIATKVGCTPQTSNERLKRTDRDKAPCAWGDDGHGRPVQGPGAGEPRTLAGQRYPARGVGVFCAYRRMKPSACRAGRRSSTADTSHDRVHRQSLPGAWARAGGPVLPIVPSTYHGHAAKLAARTHRQHLASQS